MKKIIISAALVLSAGIYSNIYAQAPTVSTPQVSGDKDMRDTNLKTRSIDLERTERDARKNNASDKSPAEKAEATAEDKLAMKYADIKTDYEQIQLSQDNVIKGYQSGSKVDYAQISKSAMEINKSAMRLNSNLFPAIAVEDTEAKKEELPKQEIKMARSIRDLIVDLDNSIGNFASSPMFQNLRLIDLKVSIKAKVDLEQIIKLSAMLGAETEKISNDKK